MKPHELIKELKFRTSRSSGSGGQHVNKVSTKVELIFDIVGSKLLTPEQKLLLHENLSNRIDKLGQLHLFCEASRSQRLNKKAVLKKFEALVFKALNPPPKGKGAKPLKANKAKRLTAKRKHAEKKAFRKKVTPNPSSDFFISTNCKLAF